MSEVMIAGHKVPAPTVALAAGGLVLLFLLRGRPAPMPAAMPDARPGLDQGQALSAAAEFAMITSQAANDIARITGSNNLETKRLNLQYELQRLSAPSSFTIDWARWNSLPKATLKTFQQQIANGKLLARPTTNGIVFTSTAQGIAGHGPLVTDETSQGFFSSGQTIRGPAGSFNPQQEQLHTGLDSLFAMIAQVAPAFLSEGMGPGAMSGYYRGGGYGGGRPRPPYGYGYGGGNYGGGYGGGYGGFPGSVPPGNTPPFY